jgi:hypothetical protein
MTSTDGAQSRPSADAEALDHVWKWYEMSLSHRIQLINYYFFIVAGNLAAYIACLQAKLYTVAGSVGVVAAVTIGVFSLHSRRGRERMNAASVPLRLLQARLADRLEMPELQMVETISSNRAWWLRTATLSVVLSVIIVTAFVAAGVFAFLQR